MDDNKRFDTRFFLRSIAFSYANKVVLLVLGFLYMIVVANQLGPSLFGAYSYLLDLAGTVLFLLGMETFSDVLKVFIPKTGSKKLVRTIVVAQFLIALALAAVVFLFSGPLSGMVERGESIPFNWLSLTILVLPVSTIVYSIAMGNRQFGKLVLLSIVENLSNMVLAAVLVWGLGMGLVGVFIAKVVSLALLALAGVFWLNANRQTEIKDAASVRSFAKQSWITTIFKKIGLQANLVYAGLFVSTAALGFFYLLQKISIYAVETPVTIINDTLLPFASEKAEENVSLTGNLISKSIKLCIIISVAAAVVLMVATPIVVGIFFPRYSLGLGLVPWFVLYYGMSFDYPMGTFFRAINKPRVLTTIYIVSAANSLALGYFLISGFLVEGLLATMIIGRVLSLAIFVFYIRKSGYQVEFIPRKKDLVFFWTLGIRMVRETIRRPAGQK